MESAGAPAGPLAVWTCLLRPFPRVILPNLVVLGQTAVRQVLGSNRAVAGRSKSIAFLESVNFNVFIQIFNFRDGHVTTFRHPFMGLYLPNTWSQTPD